MVGISAASGGVGAAIAGGKTEDILFGIVQGAMVGALNHLQNEAAQNRNVNIEVTNKITGEVTIQSQGKEYITPTYEMIVSGENILGETVSEKFDVIRFGVKNGNVQTLRAGKYTVSEYYRMFGKMPAFRVSGPYAIHMLSANRIDLNFGCLAIKGGTPEWNRFVNTVGGISGLGLFDLGSSGTMHVNVQYAKTPNVYIKY